MDTNMQKRNVDTLRTSNRLMSFAVVALSVLLFVSMVALIRASGREKLVIIPATIDRPITVQGDQVSQSYLEQWGLWITHLVLDVSYESMEVTKNALMKYVHPASHGALSNRLEYETQRLKRDAASSHFFPAQAVVSLKANAVAVVGQLDVYINERRTSSSTRAYAMEFDVSNGRIFLKDFYETEIDHVFKRKAKEGDATPVASAR